MQLYHGSPRRKEVPAFGEPGNDLPSITDGRPFFVTDDYAYAELFARGGIVSVLEVTISKVVDLHDEDEQQRLLAIFNDDPEILAKRGPWDDMLDGEVADSAYFLLESPAVMRALRDEGFDGAFVPEDVQLGVKSYALFSADQIRLVSTQDCAPEVRSSSGPRM